MSGGAVVAASDVSLAEVIDAATDVADCSLLDGTVTSEAEGLTPQALSVCKALSSVLIKIPNLFMDLSRSSLLGITVSFIHANTQQKSPFLEK